MWPPHWTTSGALLGVESFEASPAGNDKLLASLRTFGDASQVVVEGTGSYGANLARALRAGRVKVVEVDRPNRQARRRSGKSDPADAVEAARAALSGRAQGHRQDLRRQPRRRDDRLAKRCRRFAADALREVEAGGSRQAFEPSGRRREAASDDQTRSETQHTDSPHGRSEV